MLAIEFTFPAGRYHATPWGRHVNEAEVEWPPSPWRIVRALIATWHRKLDPESHPESVLASLVDKLAAEDPVYRLPAATRAHSRHYMPMREGKKDKPVLIFDAFARVPKDDPLVVAWPGVMLEDEESALLRDAVDALGFLGRAESLVAARVLEDFAPEHANCTAGDLSLDPASGEMREPVVLLAPRPAADYQSWRNETSASLDWKSYKSKARRELEYTLPERLLDALRRDTIDIKRAGWSLPPGGRFVTYQRPYGCFAPEPRVRPSAGDAARITTVRLALYGKPLPLVEDAVRIGELTRKALMDKCEGALGRVPATVSGHGLSAENRHGHAFYLPEDADRDGRIDHIIIHAEKGLADTLPAFDRLTRLFAGSEGEWQAVLEGYGRAEQFDGNAHLGEGKVWESVTPYLHPWFAKKRFGYAEQIARECRERGWPIPEVEILPAIRNARGRQYRALHFHRFRSKRGLNQPDRRGCFVRLHFPQPVRGPLALGFGCHYGLGHFRLIESAAAESAGG